MKAYQEYKDTNIEWLGNIPSHWGTVPLKYVCYMKGRIGWQGLTQAEFIDEGPYLITGMNFKNGKMNWDECYHISQERYDEAPEIHVKEGDVLITKDGTIGKLLFMDYLPGPTSLNSHLLILRPRNGEFATKYLYYLLHSDAFLRFVDNVKTGTTFYGITQASMGDFRMLIFDTKEQQAIADFLDRKTAQIDTLIAKKQRQIELLHEQRTALINHAVTKGLNPNVKMKDSGVEWLGEIPSHWTMARLRWVTKSVVTGKTPPTAQQEYYENADINWFAPGDFNNQMVLKQSNKKINKLAIEDGQAPIYEKDTVLLVGIGATLGKVGIIEQTGSSNQQINAISYNEKIYPLYGSYYLSAIKPVIVSQANFATLPILNQSQTKDIWHLIPPFDEQIEIMQYVQKKEKQIQDSIDIQQRMIESYSEYRTALISEAVTGKIDVRAVHE